MHYANSSLGYKCFVQLFEKYISKLPQAAVERDSFYCKLVKCAVTGKPWYFNVAAGHNVLKKQLKEMFLLAGLDASSVSNHNFESYWNKQIV